VQELASWQQIGISNVSTNSGSQKTIMSEFNTASCGGIPGISDTFASALWTMDYTLQMAVDGATGQNGGFHAIYLHTRELNVSYSLFLPWPGTEKWKARPQYYTHVAMRAALTPYPVPSSGVSDGNGSWVVEVGLGDECDSQAAYAIYDLDQSSLPRSTPARLVLINYAENGTTFDIQSPPPSVAQSWQDMSVIYLSGPSLNFSFDNSPSVQGNVTWGGRTLVNGSWVFVDSNQSWVGYNQTMACQSGCQVTLPSSGVAVAYVGVILPSSQGVKIAASGNNSVSLTSAVFWMLFTIVFVTIILQQYS
jgi:hypothetical protein